MKKKKQKNHIFKALNGVKKYAVLTPIMMIGEVVMECLIPLIMAFLVDFLNISKSYGEGFNSVESLTSQLPNVDIVRIEDKKTTNHWQEDMENEHFKLGVTCSLKINGRYYGCSDRVYMRADKGRYYTVVFSGKMKKWNSHIFPIFICFIIIFCLF